jgi:uncharacterized SAM-dependent methyltransferase
MNKVRSHCLVGTTISLDERLKQRIRQGLARPPGRRELPAELWYDPSQNNFYDSINAIDTFFIPDVEQSIIAEHVNAISSFAKSEAIVVELGAGSGERTELLLNALKAKASTYVAVNITAKDAEAAVEAFGKLLPASALVENLDNIKTTSGPDDKLFFICLGDTLLDLPAAGARERVRALLEKCGGKVCFTALTSKVPFEKLQNAFSDPRGITAKLMIHSLTRANDLIGTNFDPGEWRHELDIADRQRHVTVTTYLTSRREQTVWMDGNDLRFTAGERITLETICHVNPEDMQDFLGPDLIVEAAWADANHECGLYVVSLAQRSRGERL